MDNLVSLIEDSKILPKQILVKNQEIYAILKNLARKLHIGLRVSILETIECFEESLLDQFMPDWDDDDYDDDDDELPQEISPDFSDVLNDTTKQYDKTFKNLKDR